MVQRGHRRLLSCLIAGLSGIGATLLAPGQDVARAQGFGGSITVADGDVFIGEPANQTLPGIVYVYAPGADGWGERTRLSVSEITDPPDGFGRSLASDGSWVIVGAPVWGDGRGAAVLYRRGADANWEEVAWLEPDGRAEGDAFGSAVALSDNMAVVSAPGAADGVGVLYVFAWDGTAWTTRSRHDHASGDGATGFGAHLALDATNLLVATAASRDKPRQIFAYELNANSGALVAVAGLGASDELGARVDYGAAFAVRGNTALVGVPGARGGLGTVLMFQKPGQADDWVMAGTLAPFEGMAPSRFGSALSFGNDEIWVGAPGARDRAGAVFRYERGGDGDWLRVSRIEGQNLGERASYGGALAVQSGVAAIAATGMDSRAGGVVIHSVDAGAALGEGDVVVGDHRGLPAIVGLDDDIACVDQEAGGYECNNVDLISFLPIKEMGGGRGSRLNDLWGWTDPESGREIAIVGRTDGTAFVDLTDPYNPLMLGDLPKTPGSRSSVWRDMKVYRDHAYIVADGAGEHGVQVFDLRRLRDMGAEPATFEPDHLYEGIHSAHNIVINEETGFAYVVGSSGGGETCGGGLHMLDLSEPARPAFAGCFADGTTGRRLTGYSHDAQCVIYRGPDEEHRGREICLGSNETALSIADVTDKENPVALSVQDYPGAAYAHQGWLTEDHRYFYMNDEGDEPQGLVEGTRTLVWDVMDLDEPVLAAEYIASTPDTDHNLYIRGNRMYQSNYGAGLRILDISNPTDPVEVAYFDNSPYGGASWSNYPYFLSGVVVLTSTGDGLFVVRNTARGDLIP